MSEEPRVPEGGVPAGTVGEASPAAAPAVAQRPLAAAWSRWAAALNPPMVVAGLALLLGLWHWSSSQRESTRLQTDLARRLAEAEASNRETRSASEQSRNGLRDLESRMGLLEARLAESQSQRIALESLYQELARNRDEWVLAEIEQILVTASQQLQLAGNVRAALIALEAADKRLAQSDRPGLLGLRRVIARDMDRLRAAPVLDVPGLALKLDNLAASVDELPLAAESRAPEPPPPGAAGEGGWRRFFRELWLDLGDVLRIRVADSHAVPLLAPHQSYFLRENLKLKLLSARVALLSRNEAGWKADTRAAVQWLRQHFDTQARPVTAALALLGQFSASDPAVQVPDLGESLQAVRTLGAGRLRGR